MKKIFNLFISLVFILFIGGCSNFEVMKIEHEALSEKEQVIFNLTENNILIYKIKNLPKGKQYEILLTYEAYEGSEKIKEELLGGIYLGEASEEKKDASLGINIKRNSITSNINMNGSLTSNTIDLDYDLKEISKFFLANDLEINLGDEIYIFHGAKGSTYTPMNFKSNLDKEEVIKVLENHDFNILIKLSIKEINKG